ncbi:MAG: hypothetical protein HW380_3943 [Magnetococcales bacterium]|nr:hypothetical protein [Magnetococcales bacterium]
MEYDALRAKTKIGSEEAEAPVCPRNRAYGSRTRLFMLDLATP